MIYSDEQAAQKQSLVNQLTDKIALNEQAFKATCDSWPIINAVAGRPEVVKAAEAYCNHLSPNEQLKFKTLALMYTQGERNPDFWPKMWREWTEPNLVQQNQKKNELLFYIAQVSYGVAVAKNLEAIRKAAGKASNSQIGEGEIKKAAEQIVRNLTEAQHHEGSTTLPFVFSTVEEYGDMVAKLCTGMESRFAQHVQAQLPWVRVNNKTTQPSEEIIDTLKKQGIDYIGKMRQQIRQTVIAEWPKNRPMTSMSQDTYARLVALQLLIPAIQQGEIVEKQIVPFNNAIIEQLKKMFSQFPPSLKTACFVPLNRALNDIMTPIQGTLNNMVHNALEEIIEKK
jgi:hypothetical protein